MLTRARSLVSKTMDVLRGLLYWHVLFLEWLAGYEPKGGPTRRRSLADLAWTAVLRAATSHWRIQEMATSEGHPGGVWLTLPTTMASSRAAASRWAAAATTSAAKPVVVVEDDMDAADRILKVADLSRMSLPGRLLIFSLWAVPVLPEMILAWGFFWATYLVGVLYALSHPRDHHGAPLMALLVLHLPIVWVLWLPSLLVVFTVMALVQALHSRAYLILDSLQIISWLTENKYTSNRRLSQQQQQQQHPAVAT